MQERINIFFTADWHIYHKNVLMFDKRPFTDLDHMHRVLINNYNATVGPNDICYFLGDVGMGPKPLMRNIIKRLNGTKICVVGNHDPGVNGLYRLGFAVVLFGAVLYIANERVTLSHCPLKKIYREDTSNMTGGKPGENWHGESRGKHQRLTFTNEGQFSLHGHIHSGPGRSNNKEKIRGRQFDVGVAANNYRPVSIAVIESWVAKTCQKERNEKV